MDKERREKTVRAQDAEADGIIEGRNAVIEALRAGATIDKIFIQKGETDKTLGHIASTARAAGVVVVDADKRKLDFMSQTKRIRASSPCAPCATTARSRIFWHSRQSAESRRSSSCATR